MHERPTETQKFSNSASYVMYNASALMRLRGKNARIVGRTSFRYPEINEFEEWGGA
jgi:hypothetical protein